MFCVIFSSESGMYIGFGAVRPKLRFVRPSRETMRPKQVALWLRGSPVAFSGLPYRLSQVGFKGEDCLAKGQLEIQNPDADRLTAEYHIPCKKALFHPVPQPLDLARG